MSLDWRNVLSRAAWTFVQGFLASFVVAQVTDWATLKQATVAAAIAGLAAVLSFIKTLAVEVLASFKTEV